MNEIEKSAELWNRGTIILRLGVVVIQIAEKSAVWTFSFQVTFNHCSLVR